MSTESKKITQLSEVKENVPGTSFFVIASSDSSNNKVSFETIKSNILSEIPSAVTIYNDSNLNNITKNVQENSDKVLGAYVGRKIYENTINKIPTNSSTTVNVSTPITFSSVIKGNTPTGSDEKELVNVEYLKTYGGLFSNIFALSSKLKSKTLLSWSVISTKYNFIKVDRDGLLYISVASYSFSNAIKHVKVDVETSDGNYITIFYSSLIFGGGDTLIIPILNGTQLRYYSEGGSFDISMEMKLYYNDP